MIPKCNPERFKRAAHEILADAEVEVLLHSQVAEVQASSGRVETVIVSNKAALVAIKPKAIIDCTGDGDVAAWAGANYKIAESL